MEHLDWVAGLLEGEGSFMAGPPSSPNLPVISCQMTDQDVLARLAKCLGGATMVPVKASKPHHKPSWRVIVKGARAREVMSELHPLMGERRKGQIDKALASYDPNRRGLSSEQRVEITNRLNEGESAIDLGAEFGVTKWAIYRVREKVESGSWGGGRPPRS